MKLHVIKTVHTIFQIELLYVQAKMVIETKLNMFIVAFCNKRSFLTTNNS